MLHKSKSEKMGWVSYREKLGGKRDKFTRVYLHVQKKKHMKDEADKMKQKRSDFRHERIKLNVFI